MNKQTLQLSITPVSCQEWPVIENMFAATFQHDIYFPLMRRRLNLARQFSCVSTTISTLLAGNVYLLRADNYPAGFLLLKKTGDKQKHLHYVAVAPEFRQQGLGRELVSFAIKAAHEHGADIFLETEVGSPAMKLYSSLGFTVDNQFHIFSLVSPAVLPGEQTTTVELRTVEENRSILTRAKEWLLGYNASVLACNSETKMPLNFHICRPASGGFGIIHCNLHSNSIELLYQILPQLAFHMKNSGGAYLVLSGADWVNLDSPWLCKRTDYVTMTRKHQA